MFQSGNNIDRNLIATIMSSGYNNSCGFQIIYNNEARLFLATDPIVGSLRVRPGKQGLSPTMILEKKPNSILDQFKEAVECSIKKL